MLHVTLLPDNTDAWTPEQRECPSYFALPESITSELNAFSDEVDALRADEDPAGDESRCERAAEIEALRNELRARKRANRRDRRAMSSFRRTGDRAYLAKATQIYLSQLHRFCNRVRSVA
jgi:hypothetical protein